jgi:DNA-binding Lrp family transcriptional regulator
MRRIMKVFMLIKTEIGSEHNVLQKLRKIKEIEESHMIYSEYDIIIGFTVQNREEIYKLRNEKIRKIPGIHQTMTLPCF